MSSNIRILLNFFKMFLLTTAIFTLFLWFGYIIGGYAGMIYTLSLAIVFFLFIYWHASTIVLGVYRAKRIRREESPEFYSIVENLARRANIPMPEVYIIPSETPNLFSTGRGPAQAAIAATEGLIYLLRKEELEGVVAHEISHIKNWDILISTIVAFLTSTIFMTINITRLAKKLGISEEIQTTIGLMILSITAPISALLTHLAVQRDREYYADRSASFLTKNPFALASALVKLTEEGELRPMEIANPSTAHMFIVDPLSGEFIYSLFKTHPPIFKRLLALEKISKELFNYNSSKVTT